MAYYTPGPKTNLLIAKFDMFIRLFGGHVAPFVRARMHTTTQFVLNETQLSAIDRDSCPIAVIPILLRLDWSSVSEKSDCRSGTYNVFNLHNNILLTTRLIHFSKKSTKCAFKIIRAISGETMYRPASGFVIGFPSELGCVRVYVHVGEDTVEKIFIRNVHWEFDVAENLVVER